ncbi:MAG: hypothetical protein V4635_03130 [Bacteroidota bacterium]
MAIPISRQLAEQIIIPFLAVTAVPILDFFIAEHQQDNTNIVFLLLFGVPTIFLGWTLLYKKTNFKETIKVPSTKRFIRLPFNSSHCLFIFIISSFFIFGGIGNIIKYGGHSTGFSMLFIGTTVFVLTAIAHDHPRVWLSDSRNLEEEAERIKNTPKEDFPMYQDGIFSYADNGFTVKLDKVTKTLSWAEITLIKAYKIDQFTVDSIVIEIHLDQTYFTISDETHGHMKFMDTAEEKLSNFKKDWFMVVAYPAFKENLTIVYEKNGS